jgi:hypothetical protein
MSFEIISAVNATKDAIDEYERNLTERISAIVAENNENFDVTTPATWQSYDDNFFERYYKGLWHYGINIFEARKLNPRTWDLTDLHPRLEGNYSIASAGDRLIVGNYYNEGSYRYPVLAKIDPKNFHDGSSVLALYQLSSNYPVCGGEFAFDGNWIYLSPWYQLGGSGSYSGLFLRVRYDDFSTVEYINLPGIDTKYRGFRSVACVGNYVYLLGGYHSSADMGATIHAYHQSLVIRADVNNFTADGVVAIDCKEILNNPRVSRLHGSTTHRGRIYAIAYQPGESGIVEIDPAKFPDPDCIRYLCLDDICEEKIQALGLTSLDPYENALALGSYLSNFLAKVNLDDFPSPDCVKLMRMPMPLAGFGDSPRSAGVWNNRNPVLATLPIVGGSSDWGVYWLPSQARPGFLVRHRLNNHPSGYYNAPFNWARGFSNLAISDLSEINGFSGCGGGAVYLDGYIYGLGYSDSTPSSMLLQLTPF